MKKIFAVLLTVCCLCSVLLISVHAAAPKVIGKVLTTDIRAYVNGAEIPAYNIDGNMVVVGSDLRNYGFNVVYDNNARTSTVTLPANGGKWEPMKSITRYTTIGQKVMDVYATDIRVIVNGKEVQAYNVDNKMAFRFSELKVFGDYKYDNSTRTAKLTVKQTTPKLAYSVNADKKTCTITGLGDFAGATSIEIPQVIDGYTVTAIGDEAFFDCNKLTSITLPQGLKSIGNWAFAATDIRVIVIPNSVTSIGDAAFYGCTSMGIVTLPNSVTYIGNFTFWKCTGLLYANLPANIPKLSYSMFSDCINLRQIKFAGNEAQWYAIPKYENWDEHIAAYEVYANDKFIDYVERATVPDLTKVDPSIAQTIIYNKGLLPAIEYEYSWNGIPAGYVNRTYPVAGAGYEDGEKITIYVSLGEAYIEAKNSSVGWKNISSNGEDDWNFYAPYIYEGDLYIECEPVFGTAFTFKQTGYGSAIIHDTYDRTVALTLQKEFGTDGLEPNTKVKAGVKTSFIIKISLKDIEIKKPTYITCEILIERNGYSEKLTPEFKIQW